MTASLNYIEETVVRPEGTPVKQYRIAPTFAQDHYERACGVTDVMVSITRKGWTVEMDPAGYADMLSDAEYYVECGHEMDWPQLIKSAKRVMEVLRKAGPPVAEVAAS
jgi:hypothetical protein